MSSVQKWKSGDVARTKAGGTIARTAVGSWVLLDDGHGISIEDDRIRHPFAVIDPESDDVDRLATLFISQSDCLVGGGIDAMQAALREFANPVVKPEEPTGLGAVVEADLQWEDGKGFGPAKWASSEDGSWICLTDGLVGTKVPWPALQNVKVLSDGIPA